MTADISIFNPKQNFNEPLFEEIDNSFSSIGWSVNKESAYILAAGEYGEVLVNKSIPLGKRASVLHNLGSDIEYVKLSWEYYWTSTTEKELLIFSMLRESQHSIYQMDAFITGECWEEPKLVEKYIWPCLDLFMKNLQPDKISVTDRYQEHPYIIIENDLLIVNDSPWWKPNNKLVEKC